ncbi:LysR family transcriptional regulator [Castellaniella caeni]|uniref:LysR family transcriptional regulator n=1 Tax=Castellaniella caeni TaxID=266123 RepID=UPI000C9F5335|nr:LysR family transcriptional regulator [Castellaniella caeni]
MHARVLRYLDEVVRQGSIRKAAQSLHVAPTAINRQILDLEAEFGAPLFDRIQRRLRLTPLGELVLAHVRKTLRDHQLLLEKVEEIRGHRRGRVTVAVTTGLADSLMPSLIHDFRQQFPGISVCVRDLPVSAVLSAVEQGEADLGLAYDLPDSPLLHVLAASNWHMGVVVPPKHAMAKQASILLSECAEYPLILPALPLSIRAILNDFATRHLLALSPLTESTSIAFIKHLIRMGDGVAVLGSLDVMEENVRKRLIFIPLRDPDLQSQTLSLIEHAQRQLSEAARLIAASITEALQALYPHGRR